MKPHQPSEIGSGVKCPCSNRTTSQEGVVPHRTMEFFLNGTELSLNSVNSANSGNLINH